MLPSMTPSEINDFTYYFRKLPLWLQNCSCFVEHFRLWYDLLTNCSETNDTIANLLNIFDPDYLTYIASFEGSNADLANNYYGDTSDILDKLATIFGVNRMFQVSYRYNDQDYTINLSLDNQSLLILIKAQIIKNYCDGSQQQIQGYYKNCNLPILPVASSSAATCLMYLSTSDFDSFNVPQTTQDNIQHLFLSGLLTIECAGIGYEYTVVSDLGSLLVWDNTNWDEGVWSR